jgi:hypothetical protein
MELPCRHFEALVVAVLRGTAWGSQENPVTAYGIPRLLGDAGGIAVQVHLITYFNFFALQGSKDNVQVSIHDLRPAAIAFCYGNC